MTTVINQIIELCGVMLFSLTLSPQIIKIINTKQVNDISFLFLVLNLCSSFLLGYSAIINKNTQFIIVNSVSIVQTLILLFLKNFYESDTRKYYKLIPENKIYNTNV